MSTATASVTHTAALAPGTRSRTRPVRAFFWPFVRLRGIHPIWRMRFGVSRQVMWNQLACLRGCGLVEAVPDGRRTWYRLADPHLAPALNDCCRSCCSWIPRAAPARPAPAHDRHTSVPFRRAEAHAATSDPVDRLGHDRVQPGRGCGRDHGGQHASSSALIAFGLDSTIEVLSAAAVAWQFTRRDPERWEKGTLRVIAVAFFALAAYVTVSSLLALVLQVDVEHSTLGLVITALSVLVMPFLSLAERRAGRELGSATAVADSKQTLICTYLSASVLVGPRFQQPVWVVVGRRDRRTRHRWVRRARGLRGVAAGRLRHVGRHAPRG